MYPKTNIFSKLFSTITLIVFLLLSISHKTMAFDNNQQYKEDTVKMSQLLEKAIAKCHHDFEGAIQDAHNALTIAQQYNDKPWMVKSYHRMGRIYESNNHLVEALFYFQNELALVDQVPNNLKIDIYFDLAKVYTKSANYSDSRNNYLKVIELCEASDNAKMKHLAYTGLGDLYSFLNDFEKAAEYNLMGIQLAVKNRNTKDECMGYSKLATLYQKADNTGLSHKYANMAYHLLEHVKDTQVIYLTHFAYAKSLNLLKKHTEALMYFEKAKGLAENYGDKANIAKANLCLAETYNMLNYRFKAEFHFNEAFKYLSFIESYDLAQLYYEYGIFNKKFEDKTDVSDKSLNMGLQKALNSNHKDLIQKLYFALFELNKKKGDKDVAYTYLQAAYAYRDSLSNDDNVRRIAQSQFEFDEQQASMKMGKVNREKMLIIAISILILLFSGLLGMYYFMRQQKVNNRVLALKNQEIEQQVHLLAESNDVLQQFAYITAHDLKEPLRSISSFVHIIQRKYVTALPAEANEYMNFVTGGVKRMENLLSALLEYSTVVADNRKVIQVTSLSEVTKEIIQNLHQSIADKNAIIRYPSVFPDILMSRVHITQIIQNLTANAIKFSETQPIVKIGFIIQEGNIVIYVKDNGIGIKEEYSDKIFKVFQRLDRSKRFEGTGIGLSICKSLVDKYSGKIWFESKKDEGTTFYISFPAMMFSNMPKVEDIDMETYNAETPLVALK
jgi:signal transduction histidine kinase